MKVVRWGFKCFDVMYNVGDFVGVVWFLIFGYFCDVSYGNWFC